MQTLDLLMQNMHFYLLSFHSCDNVTGSAAAVSELVQCVGHVLWNRPGAAQNLDASGAAVEAVRELEPGVAKVVALHVGQRLGEVSAGVGEGLGAHGHLPVGHVSRHRRRGDGAIEQDGGEVLLGCGVDSARVGVEALLADVGRRRRVEAACRVVEAVFHAVVFYQASLGEQGRERDEEEHKRDGMG